MPYKMLTNTREIQNRQTIQQQLVLLPAIAHATAIQTLEREVIEETQKAVLKTLDTASLMRTYYVHQWMRTLPPTLREDAPRYVPILQRIEPEEGALIRRVPQRLMIEERERYRRFVETEPQRKLAEAERITVDFPAILSIEQTILSMFENSLWTTRKTQVQQVMQELIEMVEQRRRYAMRIPTLEPLTRHLLQWYIPYFMEQPLGHNMLGLRLSLMLLELVKGKLAQIYVSLSGVGEQLKQKSQLLSCQLRRLETKAIALRKPLMKMWNTVHGLKQTDNLQKETEVPMFKDLKGKQTPVFIVFQILTRKYLISKYFARHVGFPENKWYYVYPRIEVIITRRGVRVRKYSRLPDTIAIVKFNRDLYFKMMSKWKDTH